MSEIERAAALIKLGREEERKDIVIWLRIKGISLLTSEFDRYPGWARTASARTFAVLAEAIEKDKHHG